MSSRWIRFVLAVAIPGLLGAWIVAQLPLASAEEAGTAEKDSGARVEVHRPVLPGEKPSVAVVNASADAQRIAELTQKVADLEGKVATLEAKLSGAQTRIEGLQKEAADSVKDFSRLAERVTTVEQRQKEETRLGPEGTQTPPLGIVRIHNWMPVKMRVYVNNIPVDVEAQADLELHLKPGAIKYQLLNEAPKYITVDAASRWMGDIYVVPR